MARIRVPILESQRLVLRGWKRRDAADLYAYAKNPNVGPHAGWKPHADVRESRAIITQMFQQNTTWAITLKESAAAELAAEIAAKKLAADKLAGSGTAAGLPGSALPGSALPGSGTAAGIPIGSIGFEPDAYRPNIHSREMGYSLNEDYWGFGIMTEAARRLLKYGFEELGLASVMIRTGEANQRSQRVIEKCGFHYEGTLRQCYRMYNGEIRDSRVYSMLREEYEELAAVW